jgi:E3 ubiquitin-protein ligase UBR7
MPSISPCTLRFDPVTGAKGVHSQEAAKGNHYNHNFQNRFCGCGEEYDADQEKGTMFQCLGLGTVETGGCGEDWWHPECLMGLSRDWRMRARSTTNEPKIENGGLPSSEIPQFDQDISGPPEFPHEDDFEAMLCFKCVESNPWIKQYADAPGFLPPLFKTDSSSHSKEIVKSAKLETERMAEDNNPLPSGSRKRKASEDNDSRSPSLSKRVREDSSNIPPEFAPPADDKEALTPKQKHDLLPPAPQGTFSLFLKEDFRDHICHCPKCYPNLIPHPQLVEEEETYEPPLSESGDSNAAASGPGGRSHGTGSLLERGEAALSTVDRVRAIEGVMVYNHLKDKVKDFLKPYAESGKPVGAEDIKAYFEKLRGDEAAIREAGTKPGASASDEDKENDGGADQRREQSGY